MRTLTLKVTSHVHGRNLHLTKMTDTIEWLAYELRRMEPQIGLVEIKATIMQSVMEDDTITWLPGHRIGIECIEISPLKARRAVERSRFLDETEETLYVEAL